VPLMLWLKFAARTLKSVPFTRPAWVITPGQINVVVATRRRFQARCLERDHRRRG
jgi:hypothetical protein